MADSFLDNAGGWTPVPDKLVREYGFEVAYVWGKVWRYCQMQNGACTASHETIAKRAGMSRRTLIDKLNILIEAGYIEDKTPDLKNKPHTYCTRIGEDKITSAMQISHTENDMPLQDNELGMRNLHSDNADNAQPAESTMQNLHLKKEDVVHDETLPTFEILYNRWLDNNLGDLKPRQIEIFGDYYDDHPDWVAEIIDTTIGGKPGNPWQYFVKIINAWVKGGKPAVTIPVFQGGRNGTSNSSRPANKSSPSAELVEAIKQQQTQDAKEIHIPGS